MDVVLDALTVAAAVGSGLIAGLFFTFSVVVMPALARLSPGHGSLLMQTVNRVIIRPLFLVPFVGTALACVALVVLDPADLVAVAGAALYVAGVFGVTMVANVPLNNALDAVAPDGPDQAAAWRRYAPRWTRWNHVRTVAATAAAVALMLAR